MINTSYFTRAFIAALVRKMFEQKLGPPIPASRRQRVNMVDGSLFVHEIQRMCSCLSPRDFWKGLNIANQPLTSDEQNTSTMEISHSITSTPPSVTLHSTSTRTLRKRY